jgi:hypothetical protein
MKSNEDFNRMPMKAVNNNVTVGRYTPKFFELTEFALSRVVFNSHFFEETDVEKEIVLGDYSFAYLRESKLRTVDLFGEDGQKIQFDHFLERMGIRITSKNLFKTGKYISRVFRPAKYGSFYSGLDIYINDNHSLKGKITDGISLISLPLAKSLGWNKAEPEKSAQFTLFFKEGLVKGHCVVSDKIEHDIIIYGKENIKDEISFNRDCAYIAIEPVKLSTTLRMDIQSLLNLWEMIGAEQFFGWAVNGIETFKRDLISGKLTEQLDDFDRIDYNEYEEQTWLLKKAIWHKLDYRRFPGLMRLAWQMYRNSISNFGNRKGYPAFRIPVSGGIRAYLRVDLRNHDEHGNFLPHNSADYFTTDAKGNLWVQPETMNEFTRILGGADQDDSVSIIPLEGGKALFLRNPNQRGEYFISNIRFKGIYTIHFNKLAGSIPQKPAESIKEKMCVESDNPLISLYLTVQKEIELILPYTKANLLRTYNKISRNSANIGIVANAEMIRSAIGITKPAIANELTRTFTWNLERVIDSVVKDGIACAEDLMAVEGLINYVAGNKVEIPYCLKCRIPESKREHVAFAKAHPVDKLLEAIMFIVNQADKEILGSGSASRGDRIPGLIDRCDVPLIEIAESNFGNPMFDTAMALLKRYNKRMSILLDSTKEMPEFEREEKRKLEIEKIQRELLISMSQYSQEERQLIVQAWAYEIYKSDKAVHDSILWISATPELKGTGEDTIQMLANVGIACQIRKNGSVRRKIEKNIPAPETVSIRVWTKEELSKDAMAGVKNIEIAGKEVLAGEVKVNLGDEVAIRDGMYAVREITPAYSRKNGTYALKNSLTLLLKN